MKYRILTLSLLCIAAMGTQLSGQFRGTCGVTDPTDMLERVTAHQKTLAENPLSTRSGAPTYVPITFILVADDNGNGRAREEQTLDQLAELNEHYAPQEIIFYMDEIRYKDHTLVFTEPAHPTSVFQMKLVRDPNALNVYVTQSANNNSGNPGQTLGYYSPQNDWIVIRKDEFNSFNNTLSHEIGHFFALPHPHSGWECEPYDEDLHGNPVNSIWSPCNGALRVEFQNGTNCQIAGDRICDTNPDYNFGFGWSVGGDQCAEFTPQIMDPNGDVIDVVENNHMSYFIDCDEYMFTPDQQDIIMADYLSPGRAYLRTGYIPVLDPVNNEVFYNYPINGEITPAFDNIELDWEDVPGATDYLVIVDRSQSFTLLPERFIVQESFLVIDELTPDRTYYWRLWPYNESRTGAGWAATQFFVTGISAAVPTIPSVERLDVYPNPVASSQSLHVGITAVDAFDADLVLYSLTGQEVAGQTAVRVEAGARTNIPMDIRKAEPGLYILKIQSADGGVISRKVSIF